MLFFVRILALILWPTLSGAVTLSHLYTLEVPMQTATDPTAPYFTTSFQELMIRITGEPDIMGVSNIKEASQHIRSFVERYGTLPPEGSDLPRFRVEYNAVMINQLLESAKKPIWGNNRPLTALWLAIDTPTEQYILSQEEGASHKLQTLSQQWAIPIALPVLDLEEANTVSVDDIKHFHLPVIEIASRRYAADTLLLGRLLNENSEVWVAEWRLAVDQEVLKWRSEASSLEGLLQQGMEGLMQRLAVRYAMQHHTKSKPLTLTITHIGTVKEYAACLRYLENLTSVDHLHVLAVHPNQIQVDITPVGGEIALRQAITLGHRLTPDGAQQYQWINE